MGLWQTLLGSARKKVSERVVAASLERALGADDDEAEEGERDPERAAKNRMKNVVLLLVGSALGLVVLLLLLSKLLKWLLGLGLLAGIGGAAYLLLKPRVTALLAARRERESALAAQRQLKAKEQQLEDELSALKERAQS